MSFQNVTGAAGNAASDFVIHRGIIGCTSVPRMTDNVKQIVTVAEGSVAHFLGGDNAALTSGTVVALILEPSFPMMKMEWVLLVPGSKPTRR